LAIMGLFHLHMGVVLSICLLSVRYVSEMLLLGTVLAPTIWA
jgi:hypothetical protein